MPWEHRPKFTLYRRADRSPNYYVQFKDPETGTYSPARSTGCASRTDALLIVAAWLKDGVPPPIAPRARRQAGTARRPVTELTGAASLIKAIRKAELTTDDAERIVAALTDRHLIDVQLKKPSPADRDFTGYLLEIWNYDRSPYIQERRAHGQRVSIRRCQEATALVIHNWKPAFQGRTLASITKADIRTLAASLANRGLAPATINKIMLAGTVALHYAKETDLIATDPSEGLRSYSGQVRKRGILTEEELSRLLTDATWTDERARVACLTAVTTGLRSGEIRAIQPQDIDGTTLHVYAWKDAEARRAEPKNGESRDVPLLPAVKRAILDLAASNPHGNDDDLYAFYGLTPTAPARSEVFINGLDAALESIGISHEARLSRHIDFHSLRHCFTTYLSRDVEAASLKAVTGHKTDSMFQLYSSHKTARDVQRVADAVQATFGTMLATKVAAS